MVRELLFIWTDFSPGGSPGSVARMSVISLSACHPDTLSCSVGWGGSALSRPYSLSSESGQLRKIHVDMSRHCSLSAVTLSWKLC